MTPRQFFAAVRGVNKEREWSLWLAAQNAGWIMGPWAGKVINGTDLVHVSIFDGEDKAPPIKTPEEARDYVEEIQREAAIRRDAARKKAERAREGKLAHGEHSRPASS